MGENNEARALEVANRALTIAEMLDERMSRHEEDCQEERRTAAKQRHDFRAEVALTLHNIKTELGADIAELKRDFGGAVQLLGNKLDVLEKTSTDTQRSVLVAVVVLLLSIAGATATKALGWW